MRTDLTVGAGIVFDNKVLLVLHAKLGKWLFPGGHIELNETPDEAVIREVKEETGLDLELLDYGPAVNSISHDVIRSLAVPFDANLHRAGDHDHYCMYFAGAVDNPDFVKSEESRDIRWFDREGIECLDGMPDNVRTLALFLLEKYKKK